MQISTSSLILACWLALAGIGAAAAFYVFQLQPPREAYAAISHDVQKPVSKPASASTAVSQKLRLDLQRQRDQIKKLQILLQERETVLQQQSALIERRTSESQRLQAEADRYLQLLSTLVDESAENLNENIEDLSDFAGASAAESALDTDALNAALEAAEWELGQSEAAFAAYDTALQEQSSQNQLIRQSILDAGDASIPVLVHILSSENVDLRVWAVNSLAAVGQSPTAVEALLTASEDTQAEVREAAIAAISQLAD